MIRFVPLLCILLPVTALASSVTVQAGGGETQNAPGDPSTDIATAGASGSIDVIEPLSIDFNLVLTHEFGTPPAPGTDFGQSATNTWVAQLGTTWTPNDHWTADWAFVFSPKSVQREDTSLTFDRQVGRSETSTDVDGLLQSSSGSIGGRIGGEYDTAGDSDFESDVTLNIADSELTANQHLVEIYEDGKKVDSTDLLNYCNHAGKGTLRCRQLRPALDNSTAMLNTLTLTAGFTETFLQNTDVSVGASYFIYDQDPTMLGYYSLAVRGRTAGGTSRTSDRAQGAIDFGGGVPLEPFLYQFDLGVAQTFGGFRLALSGAYGEYYDDTGLQITGGLRASYKFNKHWKLTASFVLSDDVESGSDAVLSPMGTLAVKFSW